MLFAPLPILQHPTKGGTTVKFWQKAYLITLALFLLALNGGIAAVLSIGRQQAFEAECASLLAQQHIVAQSLAEDAAAVQARRPQALPRLGESYAGQYRPKGIFLRVAQGAEVWADTLPQPDEPLPEPPPAGQRLHTVRTAGQQRYLYVSAMLPAPPEEVSVVCAFAIEDFFVDWARTYQVCFAASAVVSVLMAGALYAVLRGLSRPMERLAVVARRIAEGDYAARSSQRGRYKKDEVGQLAAALDGMAARVQENIAQLSEAAERKQQLVDNVAHELRTPLTAVRGYAEYIQRAELSGEERFEAVQYIVDEAGRLAAMSERLLQMAALRGEQAERKPVSLPLLLGRAARTAAPRAAAHGVTVALTGVEDCTIYGEEALLESLIVNLTDNAAKACEAGGRVELAAQAVEGGVVVTVQDNGRGMDAETIAHLGEPFYRPDKARSRAQGGAGLGLSLCFQIAQSHGALLKFASTPGVGTTAAVAFRTDRPGE